MRKYTVYEDDYMEELEKPKTRIIQEHHNHSETVEEKKKINKEPLFINPIYRYTKQGDLVDKYLNGKQMAKKLSWRESALNKAADEEKLYYGFFLTRRSYSKEEIIERFRPKEKPIKQKIIKPVKEKRVRQPKEKKPKEPYIQICKIYQYNEEGEIVAVYDNCGMAEKITTWNRSTIKTYSKQERYYRGFLLTRTHYSPQEAKQRFTEALKSQQMTYIYKDGMLINICSTLSEVKAIINTNLTLKEISSRKERHKPINNYILSNKQL